MIVTCPSCGRKFNLTDDAIKSPYQKLKCSNCSHIFMLTKEEPDPAKTGPTAQEPPTPRDAPSLEAFEEERPCKRRGPVILVAVLVLLAALGGGAYYCWVTYGNLFGISMGASDRWLSIKNLEGQEIVTQEGKVFFVSGIVFNGSTKSRKFLILRAKLYDKDGTVLAEKDVVAGLSFSKEMVGTMQKPDVEKKVNDFKLSGEEKFHVGSKEQVPFSVVFFDEGFERAKEFTVEIIESPIL
jgi:predicted Zn finger-like uncharacterized protein